MSNMKTVGYNGYSYQLWQMLKKRSSMISIAFVKRFLKKTLRSLGRYAGRMLL